MPDGRGDPKRFVHPGFIDMMGETIAGCVVLRRTANSAGNSCWVVRAVCGHELVVQGIALRQAEREGRSIRCRGCRPKRPGTVRRRAHE